MVKIRGGSYFNMVAGSLEDMHSTPLGGLYLWYGSFEWYFMVCEDKTNIYGNFIYSATVGMIPMVLQNYLTLTWKMAG